MNAHTEEEQPEPTKTPEEQAAGVACCSGCVEVECEPCDVGFAR